MLTLSLDASYQFERVGSLSPRLSRVGLVHGAVLHVFPCLATAVKTCPVRRDKTLKAVRVECDGKKTLGVKFPDWKIEDLKTLLSMLKSARGGNEGKYKETAVDKIDLKRLRAATRPENTMLTFFTKGGKAAGVGTTKSIFGSSKSTKPKAKGGSGIGSGSGGKKRKGEVVGAGQMRLAFKK